MELDYAVCNVGLFNNDHINKQCSKYAQEYAKFFGTGGRKIKLCLCDDTACSENNATTYMGIMKWGNLFVHCDDIWQTEILIYLILTSPSIW